MEKNIMLAFVSTVSPNSLIAPITYPDIQGQSYTAIQTNESAIVYVERMLFAEEKSLSKIFLIASDSVKSGKVALPNEFGDVTHLEFLRRRIEKNFPYLVERLSIENYSDSSTALEKNLLQTAEIADAVMKFAKDNEGAKIIVHADMTGGFRHASMLMLSIIQLLKYRGIEIGEVLYSDPKAKIVYSVTEIQRMFSLIAGADEFVKFGSAEALNEYFGETPPPAVKDLLKAMNHFSDAIKICRTSAIEDALKNLEKHIKTFREHPDKDLKSTLFAKIIDTVELEYGKLIGGVAERFEIIRWCMRKGFWQQAMTLCTEWLPEEIVARRVCTPCNSKIVTLSESRGHSHNKTWQQYFIVDYRVAERSSDKESVIKEFCDNLREVLKNFSTATNDVAGISSELKNFLDEFKTAESSFEDCKSGQLRVVAFKNKFPALSAVLQAIYDKRKKGLNYRKNFYQFLGTIDYEKIPSLIVTFPNDKLLELFNIDYEQIKKKKSESAEESDSKWENREKDYRDMFAKKIINLKPDLKTALEILRGYFEIRRERNQVNHANAQATKTISELKPMIESYLAALEQIPSS